MALKLNGKDDRLTRQDFLALARTTGDAEVAPGEIGGRLAERAKMLRLPAFAAKPEVFKFEAVKSAHNKAFAIVVERCGALGGLNA
jgi:serine/threonine-protein kinase HipA